MLDSKFRKVYDARSIAPFLRSQRIAKIAPNAITLAATLSGASIFFLLKYDCTSIALGALLATGFLDTLDGALARHQGTSSAQGTVFDIVSDRIVEWSIVLGLFAIDPIARSWPCMLLMGAILLCVTSFLVVGVFTENATQKSFHYSPGLIERAEAFLFFGAMILLPALFSPLSYLLTALILWTAVRRVWQFKNAGRRCCGES